jgi:hypothetical protein
LFETRILRFTIDHLRASRVVERGSSPGDYLATSVDQLVTLLFAKYAREVLRRCQATKRILRAARKTHGARV